MSPVHDYVIANGTGQAVRQDINDALAAIVSNNSSATEPTTTYSYMWWADSTAGQLKLRNAADDGWVTLMELDGTMLMEDGTVGAPGLAFASDLDTGFYRPAANELGIATNGTNAIYIDDAQQVGIGSTSPGYALDIQGSQGVGLQIYENSSGANRRLRITQESSGVTYDATYSNTGNAHRWLIAGGEAARLDGSGRLLVGTSSSRTVMSYQPLLQVEGTGAGAYLSVTNKNSVDEAPGIVLAKTRNGSIVSDGDTLGAVHFAADDGVDIDQSAAWILAQVDGTPGSNDMPGRLVFSTTADGASSPTERMRINAAGATKSSTDGNYYSQFSNQHELYQNNNNWYTTVITSSASPNPYGIAINFTGASPDNNTNTFIDCFDTITTRMKVYSDGDVWTSDAGTLTSDVTLKRDITDATPKLADVMNLRVRNFYWQEDYHPNKQDKKLIGFVAQEFEEVFPGLVSEHKIKGGEPIFDEDGNYTGEKTPEVYKKGIKEGKLIPILVKALQEAVERIETLEQRLSDAGIA